MIKMTEKPYLKKALMMGIVLTSGIACANEVDIRLGGLVREEALRKASTNSKIRSELDNTKYATSDKSLNLFGYADVSKANELLFISDLGSKKIEVYQGRCIDAAQWTFANEEKWSVEGNAYENLCKHVRKFFGENEEWHVRTYAALCSRDFLKNFFFQDLLTDGSTFNIKIIVDIAKGYQYAWGGCAEIFVQVNEVLPNGKLGYGVDFSVTIKKTDRKTEKTNCVDIMQITVWRSRNEKNQVDTIIKDGVVVYERKSLAEEQLAAEAAMKERQLAIEKAKNEKLLKAKRDAKNAKRINGKANNGKAVKGHSHRSNLLDRWNGNKTSAKSAKVVAEAPESVKVAEKPAVVEQSRAKGANKFFRNARRHGTNQAASARPHRGLFNKLANK